MTEEEQHRRELQSWETNAEAALEDGMVGGIVAAALDGLAIELRAIEQERSVAALMAAADRDRRLKEAEERGRREEEERIREAEDARFAAVMGARHQSLDSYLHNIISATVSEAARSEALAEASLKCALINRQADELEAAEAASPRSVATDLLQSFLIPRVKREFVKTKIRAENRKYADAAKAAIMAANAAATAY
eukprot:GHVU01158502.1.p2 GENE.GHVU01158502.1~~GHVU01158502.1.p2  ORF type:complete len:195 (-),score=45.03 GHVU01158502.1:559-1143(-)